MEETPQLVYGRLLEAAHFGGYAAERVASEFKWLLIDSRWKQIGNGFDDIDKFLADINLAKYRISIEDRKEIAKLLDAERATQRAAAKALGVSVGTINSDVQNRTNGSQKVNKNTDIDPDVVQNRTEPAALFQKSPADVIDQIERQDETKKRRQARDDQKKAELHAEVEIVSPQIIVGDFRQMSSEIADSSIELIFTDPPYDRESLELYGDAARIASRILKPGGSLIAYCGHYLLPELLPLMQAHLRYWWMNACIHSGAEARMQTYGVVVGWKPMLWFTKDARGDRQTFVSDVVSGGREKNHHDWQQSEAEAAYYIEKLTSPNGLVVDFFAGGGTTCVAAQRLGRPWIAFELNPVTAKRADERLQQL